MSTTEILAMLPGLPSEDLESIQETVDRLLLERDDIASPELLAAIAEAEASFEQEGGTPIHEVIKKVESRSGK